MISGIVNKTSLNIKVALVASIAIFLVCSTLAFLYGAGTRSLTRAFVEESGSVQAAMAASSLYGPIRFDDAASAQSILAAALAASRNAGLAAIIMKPDGTVFATSFQQDGDVSRLIAQASTKLEEGLTTPVIMPGIVMSPIRKDLADEANPSIGVLAFEWRPAAVMAEAASSGRKAVMASLVVAIAVTGQSRLASCFLQPVENAA